MSYSSTREAVERLCASELDDRVLRARVIERLRYSIDLDWYVWVLTDPRRASAARRSPRSPTRHRSRR